LIKGSLLDDAKNTLLDKEIKSIYKEIEIYKREIKAMQVAHSNTKNIERFHEAENKFSEKRAELKMLELEKKTLEKTIREKNKVIQELEFLTDQTSTRMPNVIFYNILQLKLFFLSKFSLVCISESDIY